MLSEDQTEKFCPGCETWKSVGAFPKSAGKKDGLHSYCKICHSKRESLRQKLNYDPAVKRAKNARDHYGLTREEYQALILAHNGYCDACGRSETKLDSRIGQVKNLHIDHDHTTGRSGGYSVGDVTQRWGY